VELISKINKPLLIHAAGGVGKTVFLESLAKAISENDEIILFDCFGGGGYRAPEDARHLPKRGLIHVVNILACRGLCDPLLPSSENVEGLVKAFRLRLSQAVETLRRASSDKEIVLLIDAIDNAAEHANDRRESAFPKLILESIQFTGPIPGVRLVVSCRSHRIDISKGEVDCIEFPLRPFSLAETEIYLRHRLKNVTQTEIQVAHARSGGNARILEHLVSSDRGLLDKSEISNSIALDDLLSDRIKEALSGAFARGYKKADTNAFLAGLSVLPPPVPLEEYAGAHAMDVSAIESFAADLAPLLERTKYGLMFRDEPTETLIRERYGSDLNALDHVAKNLFKRQDSSVYAARALPGLLQKLDDGKGLFKLAFDERFPQSITSTVGKRNIRYARLKAAALQAAYKQDHNQLVHLLVELSTIAAVDQRGGDYILDYPDLVITAQDVDATRRLFESHTNWPGTRHARLAIAHILAGDLNEAYRHAVRTDEWILHYRQQDQERDVKRSGPESLDIAAIPFCLIAQNRAKRATLFMREWKDWYGYEVSEHLFHLLERAKPVMEQSKGGISEFLDNLTDSIGVIASALSFAEIDSTQRKQLIKKLSRACKKTKLIEVNDSYLRERKYHLRDGLLKASAVAVSIGLRTEALAISSATPHERPDIWSFRDHFSDQSVFPFLAHIALISAVKKKKIQANDILPKDLMEIFSGIRIAGDASEYKKKLLNRLQEFESSRNKSSEKTKFSYEKRTEAEHFIKERLEPLLLLARAFSELLGAPTNNADKPFLALLHAWQEIRKKRDAYSDRYEVVRFFQSLGCQIAVFALWTRSDLKIVSVRVFLKRLHEQEILSASTLIRVIAILAKRSPLHALAGQEALKARSLIEKEDGLHP
jgi:hypothetical protein